MIASRESQRPRCLVCNGAGWLLIENNIDVPYETPCARCKMSGREPDHVITKADLELVEQLDRAATRGPWTTGKHAGVPNTIVALAAPDVSLLGTESDGQAVFLSRSRTESVSNAEFCAAARELLPRFAEAHRELLAEFARLKAENEELRHLAYPPISPMHPEDAR